MGPVARAEVATPGEMPGEMAAAEIGAEEMAVAMAVKVVATEEGERVEEVRAAGSLGTEEMAVAAKVVATEEGETVEEVRAAGAKGGALGAQGVEEKDASDPVHCGADGRTRVRTPLSSALAATRSPLRSQMLTAH